MMLTPDEILPTLKALEEYFERCEDLITDLTVENQKLRDEFDRAVKKVEMLKDNIG